MSHRSDRLFRLLFSMRLSVEPSRIGLEKSHVHGRLTRRAVRPERGTHGPRSAFRAMTSVRERPLAVRTTPLRCQGNAWIGNGGGPPAVPPGASCGSVVAFLHPAQGVVDHRIETHAFPTGVEHGPAVQPPSRTNVETANCPATGASSGHRFFVREMKLLHGRRMIPRRECISVQFQHSCVGLPP